MQFTEILPQVVGKCVVTEISDSETKIKLDKGTVGIITLKDKGIYFGTNKSRNWKVNSTTIDNPLLNVNYDYTLVLISKSSKSNLKLDENTIVCNPKNFKSVLTRIAEVLIDKNKFDVEEENAKIKEAIKKVVIKYEDFTIPKSNIIEAIGDELIIFIMLLTTVLTYTVGFPFFVFGSLLCIAIALVVTLIDSKILRIPVTAIGCCAIFTVVKIITNITK